MAKKLYEESNIKDIANALREVNGTETKYKTSEMGDAVRDIGGSGEVAGVVWTETDIDGYPIKVDASSVINTQNLFRYGDYARTEEIILPTNRPINTYYICYMNSNLKKINLPTDAQYYAALTIDAFAFMGCKLLTLSDWQIPNGITFISHSSFESAEALTDRIIPSSVTEVQAKAFNRCYSMQKVTFLGTPPTIANNSFANCTSLKDIYVPWAEGTVANAPWGATNATIHYNTVYDENHEPIV